MIWVAAGAAFVAMALAIGSVICSPKVGFKEDAENPGFGLIGVVGGSEKWSKALAIGSALLGGLSGVLGVLTAT